MKGIANILLGVGGLVIFLLLMTGVASNWEAVAGDVLGIFSFFNALTTTITEIVTISNIVLYSTLFIVTQGIFIYVYYRIGRVLFVRIPEIKKWVNTTSEWIGTRGFT